MSWTPIATSLEAVEALDAIVSALGERSSEGPPASLIAGDLGASLVFGYMHQSAPSHRYDELAAMMIERTLDRAEPSTPYMSSGFVGLAFVLEHLGLAAEDDLNAEVDLALLELVRTRSRALGHDWFRGAAGLAVYAIERLPRPTAVACVVEIVALLARTAEWSSAGACWRTDTAHAPALRERFPDGAFALDPAHGHLGPVCALAAACAHGIAMDVARPLLDAAVDWLWSQRFASGEAWFPAFVGDTRPPAAGWCRGDIGIAAALSAAGIAVDATWRSYAREVGLLAAGRPPERCGVTDPALCHGAAGLTHAFNRLYQATGELALRDAALLWLDRLLAMRRPGDGIGGFVFPDVDDPERGSCADPSLLFGAAGVALVLHAATTAIDPEWDRCLLYSVRPP